MNGDTRHLEADGAELMAFSLSAQLQYPSRTFAMRSRRLAQLLPIALAAAPVILAQALSIPAFVVPNFTDLTIKKRHSFGSTSSRGMVEVLYLKGARGRREFLFEQPGNRGPSTTLLDP